MQKYLGLNHHEINCADFFLTHVNLTVQYSHP